MYWAIRTFILFLIVNYRNIRLTKCPFCTFKREFILATKVNNWLIKLGGIIIYEGRELENHVSLERG